MSYKFKSDSVRPARGRILAVIVVFERGLEDVKAWPFLRSSLDTQLAQHVTSSCGLNIQQVLIYDNSALERARPEEPLPGCVYVHDPSNGGTTAAYSRACEVALDAGVDWLLLLDQDTALPLGFLAAADIALTQTPLHPAALVPWVFHGSRIASPARLTSTGRVVPLKYEEAHDVQDLTAISSGSLLSVPALVEHLPMPSGLWLDYVDHWIFAQFKYRGLPVVIFDSSIEHNLSIFALESMNARRLASILDGELLFIWTLGIGARLVYPLRLTVRLLRYMFIRPVLAFHLLAWFFRRLTKSMR